MYCRKVGTIKMNMHVSRIRTTVERNSSCLVYSLLALFASSILLFLLFFFFFCFSSSHKFLECPLQGSHESGQCDYLVSLMWLAWQQISFRLLNDLVRWYLVFANNVLSLAIAILESPVPRDKFPDDSTAVVSKDSECLIIMLPGSS